MNGKQWCVAILMAAGASLFPGCLDRYQVNTVVMTDGTCERTITLTRDSRTLPDAAFPVPVDSTWACGWTEREKQDRGTGSGEGGKEYVYTATKRFPDFDALTQEYSSRRDAEDFEIQVQVEKKFRWFYTYFDYRETYKRFNPIFELPPSAMMTGDEIQRMMGSEKPDSALEAKWYLWTNRNRAAWIFGRLMDSLKVMNDPDLPAEMFEARKEDLVNMLADDSTYNSPPDRGRVRKEQASPHEGQANLPHGVMEGLVRVLGTPGVWKLKPLMDSISLRLMKNLEISHTARGEYANTVVMPGVILETNAGEVRGTTVVWRFTHEQLAMMDYSMHVESRTVNLGILIATGVLAILGLGLPMFWRRQRRA